MAQFAHLGLFSYVLNIYIYKYITSHLYFKIYIQITHTHAMKNIYLK